MARGRVKVSTDTAACERMLSAAVSAVTPPSLTQAIRAAAKVYAQGIAARAPRKTGALARSFDIASTSTTSVDIGSDLIYAPVQEYGAKIKAKKAKALRFYVGKQLVFARSVTIPARPYVAPTFAADTDRAIGAFGDRIDVNLNRG
jgi:phage gpG-like protein